MEKLELKNAKIVFANLKDEGFGTSLTIKVTAENEKVIKEFWKNNKIGNDKTVIGEPTIKDYEGTKQLSLKINDATKYAGINGLTTDSLGFGSVCDLIVNAFEYNNKFTKGKSFIGASVSAVVILSGKKTGNDADLNYLLSTVSDTMAEQQPCATGEQVG
jgi:hypothetical protein